MHALSIVVAVVVAATSVVAQNDTSLGLKAIKAHFTQSALVPDLFTSFDPTALITLTYTGVGELQPGQPLTKEQAGPFPTVGVSGGNSSAGNYTLAMIDAGVVGEKLPEGVTRHWLVNGVSVSGTTISNTSAVGVTAYAGPWPAAGSGPHRYVLVLYSQPASFNPPANLSEPGVPVGTFFWQDYVKSSGLGPLVAATYFTVQEGTSTISLSPTSAVITSTLAASQSGVASRTSSGVASSSTNTSGAVNLSFHGYLLAVAVFGTFLAVSF